MFIGDLCIIYNVLLFVVIVGVVMDGSGVVVVI